MRRAFQRWAALALLGALLLPVSCARTLGPGRESASSPEPAQPPPGGRLPGSPMLNKFRLLETIEHRSSTEYALTNGGWFLKIEVIPELEAESAKTLLEESILSVEALYANALSPYPGDISKEVVSDPRYRPQLRRVPAPAPERAYYSLHANARFGYGATTSDAVRYRSLLGWFYCPRRGDFYKVRCYAPLTLAPEELQAFFLSLTCP
jgi:hypothetical protein